MNREEGRRRIWEYDGIFESGARHDVSGKDVFLEEVVHGGADGSTFVLFFFGLCRERGGAWEGHAEGFCSTGHGVCGVHLKGSEKERRRGSSRRTPPQAPGPGQAWRMVL